MLQEDISELYVNLIKTKLQNRPIKSLRKLVSWVVEIAQLKIQCQIFDLKSIVYIYIYMSKSGIHFDI